jgi:chemotaxis protein methyltransferase CheR
MQLTSGTFDDLRKAIHGLCGLVIADDKRYLIVSRLEPILRRNALPSYESLVEGLKGSNSLHLQEQIVEAITTRETSFNRDGHPFAELRRSILPELATRLLERRARTRLFGQNARIWCTAVATGQEAYSVAMAVSDFLSNRPGLGLTLDDFPILATDISPGALAAAREGRYSALDISRGIPAEMRERYFRQDERGWVVIPSLRRVIEWRRLNLIQPLPNLGAFDLILCRNLLIYLDAETRRRLCRGLHQALNPGGILMIGAAESVYGVTDDFSTERLGNTMIHRKH